MRAKPHSGERKKTPGSPFLAIKKVAIVANCDTFTRRSLARKILPDAFDSRVKLFYEILTVGTYSAQFEIIKQKITHFVYYQLSLSFLGIINYKTTIFLLRLIQ